MNVGSEGRKGLPENVKLRGVLSTKENRDFSFMADLARVLREIKYNWFIPRAFDVAMRQMRGKVTQIHVYIDKGDHPSYFEVYPIDLPVLDEEAYEALDFQDVKYFEKQRIWDFTPTGKGVWDVELKSVDLYFVKDEFWDRVRKKKIGQPIGEEKFYRLNKEKCMELLERMPPFTKGLLGLDSLL